MVNLVWQTFITTRLEESRVFGNRLWLIPFWVVLIHVFRFLVYICRFMVRQAWRRGCQNLSVGAFKLMRISFFFQIRFHCCVGSIANNRPAFWTVAATDSAATSTYDFSYGICLLIIFHSTFAC